MSPLEIQKYAISHNLILHNNWDHLPTGGKLSEEELNALIAHAHRRIEQLQRQLAEQGALEELRIRAALDKQREEDEIIADGRIEQEKELLKGQFSLVRDKWVSWKSSVFYIRISGQVGNP